jgi:2-phosphinomethylmalic acid synthase
LIFLIKQHLGIELPKDHPALANLYQWLTTEFDNGRQTSIEWEEIAPFVEQALATEPA